MTCVWKPIKKPGMAALVACRSSSAVGFKFRLEELYWRMMLIGTSKLCCCHA